MGEAVKKHSLQHEFATLMTLFRGDDNRLARLQLAQ